MNEKSKEAVANNIEDEKEMFRTNVLRSYLKEFEDFCVLKKITDFHCQSF